LPSNESRYAFHNGDRSVDNEVYCEYSDCEEECCKYKGEHFFGKKKEVEVMATI